MNTGALPKQWKYSRHRFQAVGAAVCLSVAFLLGWSVHAHISVNDPIAGVSIHPPFFSPNGGARDAILSQIDQARSEILVALYYFTDPVLADALITAKNRGVTVQVILDRSQKSGRYSQAKRLSEADIDVRFDSRHRILHHKFMVMDSLVVVTGSQNWTKSAETVNAENTLILKGDVALIQNYRNEFHRLHSLSKAIVES